MTLQIAILKAEDLPVADKLTGASDPFVKIYLQGPIKTYVGKTQKVIKNLNPQWNETFNFPAIRGMKLLLEVYDFDRMATNQLMAFATFDPTVQSFGRVLKIPLTRVLKKKGENASITISVKAQPIPIPSIKTGTLSTPFYISFEPSTRLWADTPFSSNPMLPFLFPYHLYFIAIDETNHSYEISSPENKHILGAWHSGSNVCLSSTSLTEVIRIDPNVLSSAGFKTFMICIGTTDFSPLIEHFQTGELLLWQSNEETGSYSKYKKFKIDSAEKQMMKLAERITFTPNKIGNLGVITGGTIDNSGRIVLNLDSQCLIPIEEETGNYQTTQTISESISTLGILSKITKINLNNKISFPLFTPIPISSLIDSFSNQKLETISARITNAKNHYLFGIAYKSSLKGGEEIVGECNPKNSNPSNKGIQNGLKYSNGTIQINFESIDDEIKFIFIGITGEDPLNSDAPSAIQQKFISVPKIKKGNNSETGGKSADPMISIAANSKELMKIPMKLSCRNNTLIWFTLIRDPLSFGGWSLFNMSRGFNYEQNFGNMSLVSQYIATIKEIMRI